MLGCKIIGIREWEILWHMNILMMHGKGIGVNE
jgi:hypothetical protein